MHDGKPLTTEDFAALLERIEEIVKNKGYEGWPIYEKASGMAGDAGDFLAHLYNVLDGYRSVKKKFGVALVPVNGQHPRRDASLIDIPYGVSPPERMLIWENQHVKRKLSETEAYRKTASFLRYLCGSDEPALPSVEKVRNYGIMMAYYDKGIPWDEGQGLFEVFENDGTYEVRGASAFRTLSINGRRLAYRVMNREKGGSARRRNVRVMDFRKMYSGIEEGLGGLIADVKRYILENRLPMDEETQYNGVRRGREVMKYVNALPVHVKSARCVQKDKNLADMPLFLTEEEMAYRETCIAERNAGGSGGGEHKLPVPVKKKAFAYAADPNLVDIPGHLTKEEKHAIASGLYVETDPIGDAVYALFSGAFAAARKRRHSKVMEAYGSGKARGSGMVFTASEGGDGYMIEIGMEPTMAEYVSMHISDAVEKAAGTYAASRGAKAGKPKARREKYAGPTLPDVTKEVASSYAGWEDANLTERPFSLSPEENAYRKKSMRHAGRTERKRWKRVEPQLIVPEEFYAAERYPSKPKNWKTLWADDVYAGRPVEERGTSGACMGMITDGKSSMEACASKVHDALEKPVAKDVRVHVAVSDIAETVGIGQAEKYAPKPEIHENAWTKGVYAEEADVKSASVESAVTYPSKPGNWEKLWVDDVYGVKGRPDRWKKKQEGWKKEESDPDTFVFRGVTDPAYIRRQEKRQWMPGYRDASMQDGAGKKAYMGAGVQYGMAA